MSLQLKRLVSALVAAGAAVVLAAGPAAAFAPPYDPEPYGPYAQPVDASVPKRGCTTTLSNPKVTTGSIPAIQVIYAWHDGGGNNYATHVQNIAKIVDRMDWSLDESTNYDQHLNLSCRTGYDTSTYAGYAQALVVPEKIENGVIGGETPVGVITADLTAAGYDTSNRRYIVFEDFDGTATASYDPVSGLGAATVDGWASGSMLHELVHLGHPNYVDHSKVTETPNVLSYPELMSNPYYDWLLDHNFNTYYDPSETGATFYTSNYPDTRKVNVAAWPYFTTPTCCDVGYSNDLLTAQERTIEADSPSATPSGFSVSGGGWMQVTPSGPDSSTSARYYDGRRSLTMNVQSHANGFVSVTRKPAVTAGQRYKFWAWLTTATSGNVRLRLSWYNSSGTLLSTSDSSLYGLTSSWAEYSVSAIAPANATSVQLSVMSPSGQTFAYRLDALQLNHCNNGKTTDGCRLPG
ncbi:hypothetical protein GCM10009677_33350 [Sphaerisporangium rubeum]|uniref:CBM-cenC domain-containing protein n=1 Tax=Sphaerisporangium rubeum TaxID=321317 RepID=A0A7X0IH68_9ACTN|nr:hypothetical protein [Sphaerisporangium rubeum]MBB6474863.1 hypothetical protein [Sphaerisporangium rubeum]